MQRLLLFILLITLLFACRKNVAEEGTCKIGFIVWGGSPAADGLGWYFTESLSNRRMAYKFNNLSAAFQKNKLPVAVCFVETGEKYGCYCTVPLPLYRITAIRKRLF